jgi:hypothetical protein
MSFRSPPTVRTATKPQVQGGTPRRAALAIKVAAFEAQYNYPMADRIACSCVTCPKCGTWIVVKEPIERGVHKDKFRANCPAPECGKAFEFERTETRVFEIPLPLFERRHFYGSELR